MGSRASLAQCLAAIVSAPVHEIPLPADGEDAVAVASLWLARSGRGLVPVADPQGFAWPGPWIALREHPDGGTAAVVMFGSPSGTLVDPAGAGEGRIVAGWIVTPHDPALWDRRGAPGDPGAGTVRAICVSPAGGGPMTTVDRAPAVPGRGLQGDRYHDGAGEFPSGRPGSALTLIDATVLDDLGLGPTEHRRNVVTEGIDLDALVGRAFRVGDAECFGQRLCEPCAHLDRLLGGGWLRPLVHRGGLRADIVTAGTIVVGDEVRTIAG